MYLAVFRRERNMHKRFSFSLIPAVTVLAAAMLLIIMPLNITVSAQNVQDETAPRQIQYMGTAVSCADAEPAVYRSIRASIIDGFDSEAVTWLPESNITNITSVINTPLAAGCTPFSGERFLAVSTRKAPPGEPRAIVKSLPQPANYSAYGSICAAVWCPDPGIGEGRLEFTFTIGAVGGSYTASAPLRTGCWNAVFADILGWEGRSAVTSFSLGISCAGTDYYELVFPFCLDEVSLCTSADAAQAMRYLAPVRQYDCEGCELGLSDAGSLRDRAAEYDMSYMKLTFGDASRSPAADPGSAALQGGGRTEDGHYVGVELQLGTDTHTANILPDGARRISVSLPEGDITGGTSMLRLLLDNRSGAESVTLRSMSARSTVTERTAGLTDGLQSICLPVNREMNELELIIAGGSEGEEIHIYSILPAASYRSDVEALYAYTPAKTGRCVIESCRVSSDRSSIEVTVKPDAQLLTRSPDAVIELYDLEPYASDKNDFFYESIVRADVKPISEHIVLRTAAREENIGNRFVVCIKEGGSPTPIAGSYVTNPEQFTSGLSYPDIKSKKGMDTPNHVEAGLLGIRHTTVQIELEKLTADGSGNVYHYDGTSTYYDEAYLSRLDGIISAYTAEGISVTAILTVSRGGNGSLLCHPDSTAPDSGYAAFNTGDKDGIAALGAAAHLIAKRYSGSSAAHGRIVNYVVGHEVQNAAVNYNLGGADLRRTVSAYAEAFRTIYNAVKSAAGTPKVFISLGCGSWQGSSVSNETGRFDVRDFLEAFSEYVRSAGDIAWGLMYNPYPCSDSLYSSIEAAECNSLLASRVTPANLSVLTGYLESLGGSHPVILRDTGFFTPGAEKTLTVSARYDEYVYAYLKAVSLDIVKAYITAYLPDSGRLIERIDTAESKYVTEKRIIGRAWSDLIEGYTPGSAAVRNIVTDSLKPDMLTPVSSYTGTAELLSFDSDLGLSVWKPGAGCVSLASSEDGSGTFAAELGSPPDGSGWRYVTGSFSYPLNLTSAPYVTLELSLTGESPNLSDIELLIVFRSGSDIAAYSGRLSNGIPSELTADLSTFPPVGRIESINLYVRGADGDFGTPTLYISPVRVSSNLLDSSQLSEYLWEQKAAYIRSQKAEINTNHVIALAVVILVCSTILVIRRMNRRDDIPVRKH